MRPKVLLVEDSTSLAILYKQYVKDEPMTFSMWKLGEKQKRSLSAMCLSSSF